MKQSDVEGNMKTLVSSKNITVFQSQLYQTNSTVIETGDCVIVVDPTWLPNEVAEIQHFVEKIRKDKPMYLIFTHSDWDHIIGYRAFPDAITIGSKEMEELESKHEVLEQIDKFDQENYISRDYEIAYPSIAYQVQEDGQTLEIGQTKLTFYKAKGHTNDGIFTIIEPLGVWIAGDYLSDVEPPYIYSSSVDYVNTLEKVTSILNKHEIQLLVPGHGGVTSSLKEILNRQQTGFVYIEELRKELRGGKSEEEMFRLIEGYQFPKGIKPFHLGNIKVMKKEM
jgi:hydroxyacylglutathione hydrolase